MVEIARVVLSVWADRAAVLVQTTRRLLIRHRHLVMSEPLFPCHDRPPSAGQAHQTTAFRHRWLHRLGNHCEWTGVAPLCSHAGFDHPDELDRAARVLLAWPHVPFGVEVDPGSEVGWLGRLAACPNLVGVRLDGGDSGDPEVCSSAALELPAVAPAVLGRFAMVLLGPCTRLIDPGALRGVHALDLSECRSLSDVSMLGRVHTLGLAHCPAVRVVSALDGVHTLDLTHCSRITDVSMLGAVCGRHSRWTGSLGT